MDREQVADREAGAWRWGLEGGDPGKGEKKLGREREESLIGFLSL